MSRFARCERDTKETEIVIELDLDGTGQYDIHTGIGFFDHMLEGFAKHGLFDLAVSVQGDTHVDAHHTVEDTGIVLGQAFLKALGDKKGIARFGYFVLPMDDALVLASLDFSGRMYFAYDAELKAQRLGTMETEVVKEFFMGLASGAQMNLHIKQLAGENTHHVVEAMFKAVVVASTILFFTMASSPPGQITTTPFILGSISVTAKACSVPDESFIVMNFFSQSSDCFFLVISPLDLSSLASLFFLSSVA